MTWLKRSDPVWLGLLALSFGCGPPGFETLDAGADSDETSSSGTTASTTGSSGTTASTTGGTSGGGGGPFALESAQFTADGQGLRLRFTEPVAAPEGVDPADFRVSRGQTTKFEDPYFEYTGTVYLDINYQIAVNTPPYDYNARLEFDDIVPGNLDTDLLLIFDGLEPNACAFLTEDFAETSEWGEQPGIEVELDLLVHYSPGAVPVRSVDDEVLEPIGPDWVEAAPAPYLYVEGFGWPLLDPVVSIPLPCP